MTNLTERVTNASEHLGSATIFFARKLGLVAMLLASDFALKWATRHAMNHSPMALMVFETLLDTCFGVASLVVACAGAYVVCAEAVRGAGDFLRSGNEH